MFHRPTVTLIQDEWHAYWHKVQFWVAAWRFKLKRSQPFIRPLFCQPPRCVQQSSSAVGQAAVSACPGAVMGKTTVQTTVMKRTVRTQVGSPRGTPGPSAYSWGGGRVETRCYCYCSSWTKAMLESFLAHGLDFSCPSQLLMSNLDLQPYGLKYNIRAVGFNCLSHSNSHTASACCSSLVSKYYSIWLTAVRPLPQPHQVPGIWTQSLILSHIPHHPPRCPGEKRMWIFSQRCLSCFLP